MKHKREKKQTIKKQNVG